MNVTNNDGNFWETTPQTPVFSIEELSSLISRSPPSSTDPPSLPNDDLLQPNLMTGGDKQLARMPELRVYSRRRKPEDREHLTVQQQSHESNPNSVSIANMRVKQSIAVTEGLLYAGATSIDIIGKKPSWKIGSSFSIKKTSQSLPKVHIDDDMDLIDEDSLLTEEDLKKPQPLPGDCEVGSTRKACKNCTCGRAEAEEKVQKLGLTMDQLDNPQSACGNSQVRLSGRNGKNSHDWYTQRRRLRGLHGVL
ncbi:unnamed protein product [Fraxinus pennsylvanica]|uniref:Uncharacterized protein n=1 Tax=Fraxinus pennsylvanica TaxID=56036 RepID=A0AAD2E5K5_9LAMI|nr:unnamed protein product [Fraxinus pennsylvanica]